MAEQVRNKPDPVATLNGMLEMDGAIAPYYNYFDTNYSVTNMAYLWIQGAREIIGKKRDWANVQREPLPNAHRYRIWVPWFRKLLDPNGEDNATIDVLAGFNDVPCIYTYSQTTGEPIKPKPVPKWDVHQMLGKFGIRMAEFRHQSGNVQGYATGTEIAVSPIAANWLKTVIHETGHIALGHTLEHPLDELATDRSVKEFQAEAVSYVVLNLLGVMDEETARYSRGYVRHYMQNEKPSEQACRQVLTVADRIWRAGRVAVAAAE